MSEVKNLCLPTLTTKQKKRKQQASGNVFYHHPTKSPRVATTINDPQPEPELTLSMVTTQIRGSISRWVKAQTCDTLRNVKENEHMK